MAVDKSVEMVDRSAADGPSGSEREGRRIALGIFAKEPLPGRVKTRLCPPLSSCEAARLYRVALSETVTAMTPFSPVIFYAGEAAFFRQAFPDVPLIPQGEGDLGARMDRALGRLLGDCDAAALIGSDSPDLPLSLVEEAFGALRATDFVTAPSQDGGYVLVGARRRTPELFCNIPWSTAGVIEATRRRAAERSVDYCEVTGWDDVDDIASLKRLIARSPTSATARFAREALGRQL